ncbi:MAG: hypothetical protein U5K00_18585 [Melioribacteraceae bacterium]|nr:hypothetical protein [Melioribacteraceae bacterium]
MNSLSKNWTPIISAAIMTLFQIIWFKELFQWLICVIVDVKVSELNFNFIMLQHYFEPAPNTSFPFLFLLYLSPIIYLLISIETASFFLRKTPQGIYRFFFLVFILLQLGFLLINIFYNSVILIINPGLENEWIAMSIYLGFGEVERFIFVFGIIFLFVFYLNMSTRRVINYIN